MANYVFMEYKLEKPALHLPYIIYRQTDYPLLKKQGLFMKYLPIC